jgi:hypothetical protein
MRLKNPLCAIEHTGAADPSHNLWALVVGLENYRQDAVTVEVDGVTRVLETIREAGEISSAALGGCSAGVRWLIDPRDGACGAGGSDVPSEPFLDRSYRDCHV